MNENTTYIGIDNGLSGAIAFYKPATNNMIALPMPIIKTKKAKGMKTEYDVPQIIALLKQYSDTKLVILEKAQAFPGQGSVSMFSIGKGFGIMEGILAALGLSYQIIHPKSWQKKVFEGIAHKDTKQASVLTAQRLFPNVSFKTSERATKVSNGLTDAALMAYYGYLTHNGK